MWINTLYDFVTGSWYWLVLWVLSGVIPMWFWFYAQLVPIKEYRDHWLNIEDTFILVILTVCSSLGGLFMALFMGGIVFLDKDLHKKPLIRKRKKS